MNTPKITQSERALIFSYSDCTDYFVGTTREPEGATNATEFLKNTEGKLLKFPSLYRAKLALHQLGHTKAWLVMQSPYDEMIGNNEMTGKDESSGVGGLGSEEIPGKNSVRKCEMPLILDGET